ncbi:FAD-binding oxidoreductase [Burkholderia pyrrocinia]|uniref:NAD(P)/FAD-dependent oxidoreductase n=1 Tax=Burkholderia pyrrocinia TaxID=60550 RepID=UPI00157586C8|nr:FAD-dependent oxidoreductase [Burkholderia pyrrocinia]NTX26741.1 FAD-binding oxidoreductase [Burkholderia pyrrocinia]
MNDVVIVGAGAVGSSIALFCKRADPQLRVTVVDPALLGGFSSTSTAGSGGSRRLFCCPENIAMSDYSIKFIQTLDNEAADDLAKVNWQAKGYLFVVPPEGIGLLESNLAVQRRMGVSAELLTPSQIADRFPMLRVDDLGAGVYSPDDGWFDAQRFHAVVVQRARDAGVQFVSDEVVGFDEAAQRVTAARLRSGTTLSADYFVNAAGPWAREVSRMIDMPLPVNPMRRFEHGFAAEVSYPDMPYVKDLKGLAIRSAGSGFSGGLVETCVPRGFSQEMDVGWFDSTVRPAVQWRFPALGRLELTRSWSGLYEQCDFDGNAIIGKWSGNRENFIVAAGFSGHGLMHAPATGLAVAELILKGRFETLDLTRFGYERVQRNQPYRERGII